MIIIQKNTPDSYWAYDSQGHFLVYRQDVEGDRSYITQKRNRDLL